MENDSKVMFGDNQPSQKLKRKKNNNVNDLSKQNGSIIEDEIKKFNIIPSNKKNDNHVIKKVRDPSIDIIRIIIMYTLIINHMLGYNNVYNFFYSHKRKLILLRSFTDWHNDAFILISGIVGYKTNKYSNLFYLWLTVFFYSVGIHKYFKYFEKKIETQNVDINKEYFPMIFNRFWYFTSYFGMYLILPVINKGIEFLTKGEFKLVVMSTLGIFVIWRYYKNPKGDVFHFNKGYSTIWLLTYYLTGAYIGKYRINYTGIKKYIFCLIYIFIYLIASYLYYKLLNNELYIIKRNNKIEFPDTLKKMLSENYDSIIKVTQSITACLFFMQIKFNKYIGKIICFVGPLVFGVYLFHTNQFTALKFMKINYDNISKNMSLNSIFSFILLKSLKVFVISVIIDYFRNLLFTLFRFRNILVFLEKKLREIVS